MTLQLDSDLLSDLSRAWDRTRQELTDAAEVVGSHVSTVAEFGVDGVAWWWGQARLELAELREAVEEIKAALAAFGDDLAYVEQCVVDTLDALAESLPQ